MVTPAGPLAIALQGVQTLLANLPFFQAWTNTGDSAEALANLFVGEVGWPISAVAIAGGVLTVSTREPHTLTVGQEVTLQGSSIGAQSAADLDGAYTVAAVTASSFTAAIAAADLAVTYPRQAFVLPTAEPWACISEESGALDSTVIGTGGACVFAGAIEILFEGVIPSQYANDPVNALTQARSELGQLVQGLAQTQGTADFIWLNRVELAAAPQFVPLPEQADNTVRFERWQALVKVTWGLSS